MEAQYHNIGFSLYVLQDYADAEALLCAQNVDQDSLQSYAREAADFATNYQLPSLDFAINHYEQPDVAMFDFTSMYASENAALVRERHGHHLLVALVGDSLLEVGSLMKHGVHSMVQCMWVLLWVRLLSHHHLSCKAMAENFYLLLSF